MEYIEDECEGDELGVRTEAPRTAAELGRDRCGDRADGPGRRPLGELRGPDDVDLGLGPERFSPSVNSKVLDFVKSGGTRAISRLLSDYAAIWGRGLTKPEDRRS